MYMSCIRKMGDMAGSFLVVAALLLSWTSTSIATRCLQSRLEHNSCTYRHPDRTDIPGENEMGVYRTRFAGNGACEIVKKHHKVTALPDVDGSVFYLDSPNKYNSLQTNYLNDILAVYKINCSRGQYIYFELTNMQMESTTCYDATVDRHKCVDYIQVRNRHKYVISENCGNDVSNLDGTVLPFNYIEVLFRTNPTRGFPGFSATVTCFNPTGCASSPQTHVSSRPSSQSSIRQACPEQSFQKITVPYGHDLYYTNDQESSSLVLTEREVNQVKRRWRGLPLSHLLYFSSNGSMKEYKYLNSVSTPRQSWFPSPLRGPGILHVPMTTSHTGACYQDYIVNVSNLVPTRSQKEKIHKLNSLLHIVADNDQPTMTQQRQRSPQNSKLGNYASRNNLDFVKFLNYLQSYLEGKQRKRRSSYAYQSSGTCNPVLQTPQKLLLDVIGRGLEMEKILSALLILTSIMSCSASDCSLESRLEYNDCMYRHMNIPMPGSNAMGAYHTTFNNINNQCEILNRQHSIENLLDYSANPSTGSVYYLDSPTRTGENTYLNDLYAIYKVQCPSKSHFIYFNFTKMQLEPTKCWDPATASYNSNSLNCSNHYALRGDSSLKFSFIRMAIQCFTQSAGNSTQLHLGQLCVIPNCEVSSAIASEVIKNHRCVDYVLVRSHDGGRMNVITDNCGGDVSNLNGETIPFDNIEVILRTNSRDRYPGFSATVICFPPSACPSDNQQARISSLPSIPLACPKHSFTTIKIAYGHDLYYNGNKASSTLTLVSRLTNETINQWSSLPLRNLLYFSSNGSIKEYKYLNSVSTSRQSWFPSPLRGPGILHVPMANSHTGACYQDYIVDVSGLLPTPPQKKKINLLSSFLHEWLDNDKPATRSNNHQLHYSHSASEKQSSSNIEYNTPPRKSEVVSFFDYLQSRLKHRRRKIRSALAYKSSSTCNPVLKTLKEVTRDTVSYPESHLE